LVEGEYVEFSVSNTASGDHKFQAADIRGVKGGKLFCETRHEQRASGPSAGPGDRSVRGGHSDGGDRSVRGGHSGRGGGSGGARGGDSGARGGGGRGGGRGGRGEWMLVRKDSSEYKGGSSSGRVYSDRPSGQRQPREPSSSESFVEHSRHKTAPAPAPASAPAAANAPAPAPEPSPVATPEPNEVPATPRAASVRKPKQSKPSS